MKATHLLATLCFIFSFVNLARAQESTDQIVKEWERAKVYTKEYLDAMPESGYSLKPTPEMRSFAEQMLHLADANYGLVAAAIDVKSPTGPGELEKNSAKTKENVTKKVMESYDFAISNIQKMTPAQLGEKIKLFNKFDLTKEMALAKGFEHQTHHRGQTTVYLRLAGVKPPEEKLF
ncbi:damage-inducible protein DinB [Chitinophaga oryziterrae]|uniref:Damage-inducible protein DinB n=1 Tax=Chitinophaga oryziterrae TaxID=1031224 RepID=A0A6N8J9J5_9BACT|nr:DinB family protein [Chitinophaga oryziterrae]MVT41955.1 damage-inducible protein DinB [Chitinophaga oryziterrae]